MAVAETAVVMAHAADVIPPRVVGRVRQSEGNDGDGGDDGWW